MSSSTLVKEHPESHADRFQAPRNAKDEEELAIEDLEWNLSTFDHNCAKKPQIEGDRKDGRICSNIEVDFFLTI